MATLLLTAVGTLVGGPIGGALGALAGQQLDLAVLGPKARRGPRLKELAVQSSSYGAPLPRHYGRMRVAGSVIWATDLKETRDKSGGGKGKPKVVSYSYSASFAVALASRPIRGIGRIWADGNLLRGAAGDLKAAGTLRVHRGHGDQAPDPLLAAAEGVELCPAFRGLAYLVFEDLALADFGNRIPTLTVEVIADEGAVTLGQVLGDALPEAASAGPRQAIAGYSIEAGSGLELIAAIAEIAPLACVDTGTTRLQASDALSGASMPLPAPLLSGRADEAPRLALQRFRDPPPRQRDLALRYYDLDRDYQPGLQRCRGRSGGEPRTIDFPAAMAAGDAALLAERVAARGIAERDRATARIATTAASFAPGQRVTLAGERGPWLVESWTLDRDCVELELRRLPPPPGAAPAASDSGRARLPPDLILQPSVLAAFELPWDGVGSPGERRLFAAVAAAAPGWTGAALYAARADGGLDPLGVAARVPAAIGVTAAPLGPCPAALLDRASSIEVDLLAPDMALEGASLAQLADGANRALIGNELIQFARVEPLGAGRWRLRDLLRGRGGTEWAIAGHGAGERFVLLDDALVGLDPTAIGDVSRVQVAAIGLGDAVPALSDIALPGVGLQPLSPVHGCVERTSDGAVAMHWTRRARGAWLWRDFVDSPLVEQQESYIVTLGSIAAPLRQWGTSTPALLLEPGLAAELRGAHAGAPLFVQQQGDHARSAPLRLGTLP